MRVSPGDTVAAVITFYCDESFPEALASVLAQTTPPDEVIVVDDASPTRRELLESLGPEVRVIRHEQNRGPGAARQTGVDASTSTWIAFLDADDTWLPTKLEEQLEALASAPELGVHHTALTTVYADGSEVPRLDKPAVLGLAAQLRRNQVLPSAMMARRSVLESVGGWSDDRGVMEDWELTIRIVAAGHAVGFMATPLVRFRRAGHGNLSSRGLLHMLTNLGTVRKHRRLYLAELGLLGTARVVARVVHDEGCRRGGGSGLALRTVSRIVGLGRCG